MTGETSAGRVLGVVLCGGKSSRMGRDKASLEHRLGENYLQVAITRLAAVCDDVIVSGTTQVAHDRVTVTDEVLHRGPVMGILASLRYAQQHHSDACLVTPVDTPHLGVADLQRLVTQWRQRRRLTIATSDHLEPLIGIYGVDTIASLEELAMSTDRSLTRWIPRQLHQTVTLAPQACDNINTPEDLANAT